MPSSLKQENRPQPLLLYVDRITLRPQRQVLRTIAIIFLIIVAVISFAIFEIRTEEITSAAEHGMLDRQIYQVTLDEVVCYLSLITGTFALGLAIRLAWKRIVISLTRTEEFVEPENSTR
jgi:hypothetical protein